MGKNIQAIRGMHDALPEKTPLWHYLESRVRQVLSCYGYEEIRFPILEKTELFSRSIGAATDIVEKEMYTFEDRNGDSLSLRPEGTASCVRACVENGLLHNQIQRLWYMGPMFRHERPQKGRYRQFNQIGAEAYGMAGPDVDAEIILMTARLWRSLNLLPHLVLELNSLGTSDERSDYRNELVEYLSAHSEQLDEDSQRRLNTNPLRILDSKNPAMQELLADAPQLWDQLGEDSKAHFEATTATLDAAGIEYRINYRLVRGLDYYNKTVFEWVTDKLGAQGTVCAGGRYDGLVQQLGGRDTPGIGFAMGIERLLSLIEELAPPQDLPSPHAYMVLVGERAQQAGLILAERLRDELPGLRLVSNCGGGSFKSQFKKADKSGAAFAVILGEDELDKGVVGLKPLRGTEDQIQAKQSELGGLLAKGID